MKKILVLILFLSYSITQSQALPEGFKISTSLNSFKPAKNDTKPYRMVFRSSPVISSTIISNFISDIIVVDNPAGETIRFGTGKGVSRTIDRGSTFQNYYGTPHFGEDDVSGIAVYKNWVVVATATTTVHEEENIPTGTGIKVSSDYGETWNPYPQPIDGVNDTIIQYGNNQIHALPVVVEEQNLSYDILITKKNQTSDTIIIWIASWAGGIRKSTDFGASFQRVLLPPDNLDTLDPAGMYNFKLDPRDNGNHKGFSLASYNDSTIWAGTSAGINKSTNRGISWRKYRYGNTGSGSGISGNFVVVMKVQNSS